LSVFFSTYLYRSQIYCQQYQKC